MSSRREALRLEVENEADRIIRVAARLIPNEPQALLRAQLAQILEYAELVKSRASAGDDRGPLFAGKLADD
jgi:hypothetical protein